MARFKTRIAAADSNDLTAYDRMAALAKRAGFEMMTCGALAELTLDQLYDPDDAWLQFVIINSGMMKFTETSVVSGVLSKAHIEKNAALLAEKSKILARRGLKGVFNCLEPLILPEWFYKKNPELRGPACYNPCLALKRYYSPCLDRPEILAHYREGIRRLLEIAPALGAFSMYTNDSGAGICWCTGLYPGPNGPQDCKDTAMGVRIGNWLQSMLDGADDAGKEFQVIFNPVHFSKGEIYDTIKHLPKRSHLTFVLGDWAANDPFLESHIRDYIDESRRRRRGAILNLDPAMAYPLGPLTETPIPFSILQSLHEAAGTAVDGISISGLGSPVEGVDTAGTMAIMAGLARPPKSTAEIGNMVSRIAKAQVGARLAPTLLGAWRDVDYALRLWPNIADTNHMLLPFYSFMGDRWVVRPIVPAPERLTEDEAQYLSGRNRGKTNSFIEAESMRNYHVEEMKWPVALYNLVMGYMNHAVEGMEAVFAKLDKESEDMKARFMRHYRRVAMLRAVWRTQRNVMRAASIIEYFTGEKKDEYWHVIRRDESFLMPATYRRLFLEAMDDEAANCREMIKLMRESDVPLIATGDVEAVYVLPHNLPEQLEKKIAVMEAHKGDIDILFPNCPPETFSDPTYEWADKTTEP